MVNRTFAEHAHARVQQSVASSRVLAGILPDDISPFGSEDEEAYISIVAENGKEVKQRKSCVVRRKQPPRVVGKEAGTDESDVLDRPLPSLPDGSSVNDIPPDDLLAAIDKVEEERKQVSRDLERAKIENEKIHAKWKQAVNELNQFHADQNVRLDTLGDDHFSQEFEALRYEIKNLACEHFSGDQGPRVWQTLKLPKALTCLTNGDDECKRFLRSSQGRPLLAQSFIWYNLLQDVFTGNSAGPVFDRRTTGPIWAGDREFHLKMLMQALHPKDEPTAADLKTFHHWRAITASLVELRADPDAVAQNAQPVIKRILDSLEPFATSRTNLHYAISTIVHKAADLDAEFMRQHAIYYPWYPRSWRYRPNSVELCEANTASFDPLRCVRLLITPALKKQGSSKAGDYAQSTILVKCQVLQPQPPSSNDMVQQGSEPAAISLQPTLSQPSVQPSLQPAFLRKMDSVLRRGK